MVSLTVLNYSLKGDLVDPKDIHSQVISLDENIHRKRANNAAEELISEQNKTLFF